MSASSEARTASISSTPNPRPPSTRSKAQGVLMPPEHHSPSFLPSVWGSDDCWTHVFGDSIERPSWMASARTEPIAIRRAIKRYGSLVDAWRYLLLHAFDRSDDNPAQGDRVLGIDQIHGACVAIVDCGDQLVRTHSGLDHARWSDEMTPEVYR